MPTKKRKPRRGQHRSRETEARRRIREAQETLGQEIAGRLEQLRKDLGQPGEPDPSYATFAKAARVPRSQYNAWKDAPHSIPGGFYLRELGKGLDVSIDWLLGLTPGPIYRKQQGHTTDLEREVAGYLKRRVAAALASQEILADDLDIDAAVILESMVDRAVMGVREILALVGEWHIMIFHAIAIDQMLGFLAEERAQSLPKPLQERQAAIFAYAHRRLSDIQDVMIPASMKRDGVSLGRHFHRQFHATMKASMTGNGPVTEAVALERLQQDESEGRPYLDALDPTDTNFSRRSREELMQDVKAKKPVRPKRSR